MDSFPGLRNYFLYPGPGDPLQWIVSLASSNFYIIVLQRIRILIVVIKYFYVHSSKITDIIPEGHAGIWMKKSLFKNQNIILYVGNMVTFIFIFLIQ